MVHQSCSFLKLKGQTYYFSRQEPKPLQKHSRTDRVEGMSAFSAVAISRTSGKGAGK